MSMNISTAANKVNGWQARLPIALTWLRVALVPFFVAAFYWTSIWAPPLAAFLFALAAVTDWLDGWLARRWGVVSRFGAFLDPVADKIMVAIALVLIVQVDGRIWLALPAAVIIGREITVSALREWMAESGARAKVAVSWLGKLKTVLQMISVTMLLFRYDLGPLPVYKLGVIALIAAAALTLISMLDYLRAAWRSLKGVE